MDTRTIAHYKLLEKIGEGGMGAVYRAEDTRLGRVVALKFIRSESIAGENVRQRFLREARAVAALDHPNICTIFEFGEDGEQAYLAMSYVDGPPLSTLLRGGPLGIARAVDIAAQVAEGLAEAHHKGIVHRDIKPGNILLTSKGAVKIADFGLAALSGDVRLTARGTAVGTPAYMAPEQWRSLDPDPRSDIWSLGVVLFEMLSGSLPFAGVERRALGYSILNDAPASLADLRREIPQEIAQLAEQMLAKDPDRRIPSADQAALLLKACRQMVASPVPRPARTVTMTSLPAAGRSPEVVSVAVLPFINNASDPDNEYFADGITEELITGLSKVGALRVMSRASAFRFKKSDLDPQEIGRQLKVKYLLTGSIRRAGDRLRMTSELISAEDGYQLWSEVYQREARDVFAIQEELSEAILATLKIKLSAINPLAVQARATPGLQAYQLYLKGLFHWNKRNQAAMQRAIGFFQEAIDADPLYPQPYCGLADALMLSALFSWDTPARTMPRAKQAALKALEINPHQAEAHISLAMIQYLYDWDTAAAAASFAAGIRFSPRYAIGRAFHAHFLLWTGQDGLAMQEIDEAQDLDPLSLNIMTNRGWFLVYQRRNAEGAETLTRALELDPDFVRANLYLGTALTLMGRASEGIAATRKAVASSPQDPILLAWLARVYALAGLPEQARELLRQIESRAEAGGISPMDLAVSYGALQEDDRAAELMEQAIEQRWLVPILLRDPRADPFRHHPRFVAALLRAGLVP
jgi:eukaryotic-like serine/threonine-protein kinase